ncbi:uncharacterized protein LOC126938943 isoform X2 [Macaca thibetana thibetana]|uniref:uncharacterized protein LOC126938943 isoform X2 n=1 Tax=Macaca thibetana thibetana TaxID=257877 RepID=UPI0021BC87DA|nr:uncharacterized protein LOC126938943 isoform X2 [Macaca thibetana thibetana]
MEGGGGLARKSWCPVRTSSVLQGPAPSPASLSGSATWSQVPLPRHCQARPRGPRSLSRVTVRLGHVVPGPSPVSLSGSATWSQVPLPCHCQMRPHGPGSLSCVTVRHSHVGLAPSPGSLSRVTVRCGHVGLGPSPVSLSDAATWARLPLPCHCQERPHGPLQLTGS